MGTVKESHDGGVTVSVGGFFDHVFIPAYWMLNPSVFDESTGLWVWNPTYDEDDDEDGERGEGLEKEEKGGAGGNRIIKQEPGLEEEGETTTPINEEDEAEEEESGNRFEIDIGSEIRFKVKAVNFTRITTTMKGVQATTTSTATTSSNAPVLNGSSGAKAPPSTADNGSSNGDNEGKSVRRRSSSADLSDEEKHPAPMQIVGSICEDGLGLTSWWKAAEENEEENAEMDGMEGEEE